MCAHSLAVSLTCWAEGPPDSGLIHSTHRFKSGNILVPLVSLVILKEFGCIWKSI